MSDERYLGWENYATWVTNLWLTNDEKTSKAVTAYVTDYYRTNRETNADTYPDWPAREIDALTRSLTADALSDWLEERINQYTTMSGDTTYRGLLADLFSYAYGQVNWQEIVRALLGEDD